MFVRKFYQRKDKCDMTLIDRFKMLMDREQLTAGAFADKIGVSGATISHILSGRNKYPSAEVMLKLADSYQGLNLNWLLTGQGDPGIDMGSGSLLSDTSASYGTSSASMSAAQLDENATDSANDANAQKYRKDFALSPAAVEKVVKRKIREIRVFYDDNTYETFSPS